MSIELVRIDDRLIHGQLVMSWCQAINVQRIVVIDDKAANDTIRKLMLESVTPPEIKLSVMNVLQGIEALNNNKFGNEKLLLLFTNPGSIVALYESGIKIKAVNIGGMSFRMGKTQVTKAVYVDESDMKAFETLHKNGVALKLQILPCDKAEDIMKKIV